MSETRKQKTPSDDIVIDDSSSESSPVVAAPPRRAAAQSQQQAPRPARPQQQQQQQQQQQGRASPPITSPSMVNPYKRNASCVSRSSSSISANNSNSAASSRSSTPINNPYQRNNNSSNNGTRKFIGGAEQARRMARKRQKKSRGTRILRPGEEDPEKASLPKAMPAMEKFFAAALRSAPRDFLAAAAEGSSAARTLWETMCHRVSLDVPTQKLQASYDTADAHMAIRAALVLEESRHVLSAGLAKVWGQQQQQGPGGRRRSSSNHNNNKTMYLQANYIEMIPSSTHSKITFFSAPPFTKEQLYDIRPGTVFLCLPRELPRTVDNMVLGVVASANRESVEKKHCFQVVVFRALPCATEHSEWVVTVTANLITELRCFEALVGPAKQVDFLNDLLGRKSATHIRFDQTASDDEGDNDRKKPAAAGPMPTDLCVDTTSTTTTPAAQQSSDSMFRLPSLNEAQEQAASSFLNSKPNKITLVQGPPGTGKTTLLVSVMCRYLQESLAMQTPRRRRLLVCAPTNKAVSVLASRFLMAMNPDTCPCNVILAGDADKLLGDDNQGNNSFFFNNRAGVGQRPPDRLASHRPLRSIFLYSWLQVVVSEYQTIQSYFVPGSNARGLSPEDLYTTALRLERRLENSLTDLPKHLLQSIQKVTAALAKFKTSSSRTAMGGGGGASIANKIAYLLDQLSKIQQDNVWKELLRNADVIFCTLASAGGNVFKRTCRVDDLIVDEAAAATEPELYIPFHLKPSRLMAVGDPLQLPATVLSRRAIDLGLPKSLHERLMYDCKFDHTMLNVQYRMNPAISAFPSERFYQSRVGNGANVQSDSYRRGPRLLDQKPYSFLQINGAEEQQGAGGSYRNHAEAKAVVKLICNLRSLMASRDSSWHVADRVRIITFYQAQVALIKNLLLKEQLGKKIVVATVDSSQGCEADIVIVSFVRSPPNNNNKTSLNKHHAGFLTDDRRMNVALTRAKYQLICVGNVHSMQQMTGAHTLQLLAKNAESRDVVRPFLTPRNDNVNTSALDLFYGPSLEP